MRKKVHAARGRSRQSPTPTPAGHRELVRLDGEIQLQVQHVNVNRALKFMARNHHQPFRLPRLVAIARMSRRGFLKAFLKHTGMRPGQLLRQIRIAQSKRLLIENDLQLARIAAMSGYERLNSFCVAFKRETGMAPKQFQRQAWLKSYLTQVRERKSGNIQTVIALSSPGSSRA